MTIKVLLDTDIGTDIDDAVCLAYLLAQPECDLVGITTVAGEAVERAKMASALCKLAGREDIPIYPGVERPLLVEQRQTGAAQARALGDWPHILDFPNGEAVEFMRQTIRQNPGEIVLLTIGPITNAALLFAVDPEIASLLKGYVLMAGYFLEDKLEWNAMIDPHATTIAYRAQPPYHRSIGIDVTHQVTMPADEVRDRFTAKLLQPVRDFAEVWFKNRPYIVFHDPLAAVSIFDDSVCGFERGTVTVELEDKDRFGQTCWRAGEGYHEVATTVDADEFFEHFFSVLGK